MLIAGGTGSIGSEIAALALAAGWAVVLHGRSEASVEAALKRLNERMPDAQPAGLAADITKAGAIERLVEEAGRRYGRIDAVVDCVVTGPPGVTGMFADSDPDAFLALAQLSIVNLQRLAHAALPWLRRQGGCLVAFISDAGIFAAPRQALIGAARAAAIGFIRNLALEIARDNVRAHCISPSYVAGTRIAKRLSESGSSRLEQAQRRAGLGLPAPADIAPLVLFLCGDGARRITGQVISVNGGLNA